MEDHIDEGSFWFYKLPWVITHERRVTTDEAGDPVLAGMEDVAQGPADDMQAVMVLTDLDQAEQAAANFPAPGMVPATFRSMKHFAAFLKRAQERGDTHIVVDPNDNRGLYLPIERVLSTIEEQRGS